MITTDLETTARAVVARHFRLSPDALSLATRFAEDLGADSLDMVELLHALEQELDVVLPEGAAPEIRSLGDVVALAARLRS